MNEYRTTFGTVVRQPSALVPMAMALTALAGGAGAHCAVWRGTRGG
jgi:hypothetical protein